MDYDEYMDLILHLRPILRLNIPRGASVLDIGCGDGTVVNRLADNGINAVGIDLSPWTSGNNIIKGDAHILPFKSHSFDYIISFLVLGHLQDEKKTMREISRVTKPGGTIMLVHFADSLLNIKIKIWKALNLPLQHYKIYKLYTYSEAERVVNMAGFQKRNIYYTDYSPPLVNMLPKRIRKLTYSFLSGKDSAIATYFSRFGKKILVVAVKNRDV